MATVTISLPDSLKHFLEHEVQTKGYGNVSEYVRGLLRAERARRADARLEELLLEGLGSGEEIALNPKFWRELRGDAARILATKKKAARKRKAR
jgi:antitoxin ParD1/3/4